MYRSCLDVEKSPQRVRWQNMQYKQRHITVSFILYKVNRNCSCYQVWWTHTHTHTQVQDHPLLALSLYVRNPEKERETMTKKNSIREKKTSMNYSTLPLSALHLSLNPLFFSPLPWAATDSDSFIVAPGTHSVCVSVFLFLCSCEAQGVGDVCVCVCVPCKCCIIVR